MPKDLERCTEFDHQKSLYEARHAEPKGPPLGLLNRLEELRGLDLGGKIEGIRRWVDFGMTDLVTGLVISEELGFPEETARELLADAFTIKASHYRSRIASLAHSQDIGKDGKEAELKEDAEESLMIADKLRRDDFHEINKPVILPQSPAPIPTRRFRIFG